MPIDPNFLRIGTLIIIVGILFLAFTYLIDFLRPLLIAVVLIVLAYFIYKFMVTGAIGI